MRCFVCEKEISVRQDRESKWVTACGCRLVLTSPNLGEEKAIKNHLIFIEMGLKGREVWEEFPPDFFIIAGLYLAKEIARAPSVAEPSAKLLWELCQENTRRFGNGAKLGGKYHPDFGMVDRVRGRLGLPPGYG
jgi:hypothetical protein